MQTIGIERAEFESMLLQAPSLPETERAMYIGSEVGAAFHGMPNAEQDAAVSHLLADPIRTATDYGVEAVYFGLIELHKHTVTRQDREGENLYAAANRLGDLGIRAASVQAALLDNDIFRDDRPYFVANFKKYVDAVNGLYAQTAQSLDLAALFSAYQNPNSDTHQPATEFETGVTTRSYWIARPKPRREVTLASMGYSADYPNRESTPIDGTDYVFDMYVDGAAALVLKRGEKPLALASFTPNVQEDQLSIVQLQGVTAFRVNNSKQQGVRKLGVFELQAFDWPKVLIGLVENYASIMGIKSVAVRSTRINSWARTGNYERRARFEHIYDRSAQEMAYENQGDYWVKKLDLRNN